MTSEKLKAGIKLYRDFLIKTLRLNITILDKKALNALDNISATLLIVQLLLYDNLEGLNNEERK